MSESTPPAAPSSHRPRYARPRAEVEPPAIGARSRGCTAGDVALAAAPFVWLGMVVAISFVETPLKFQAPGITLPLGLQIGRLVFPVLNVLELLSCLTVTVLLWQRRRFAGRPVWRLLAGLWMLLLIQALLLRPVLDDRAARIIAGNPVPDAPWHLIYLGLELLKVITLLVLGAAAVRVTVRGATQPGRR
jgi:hypothetical protein